MRTLTILLFVAIPLCSIRAQSSHIRFTNISHECGIAFTHSDGGAGQRTIVESVVAGLATFDFDNDGLVDIFFVNGRSLDGKSTGLRPALYRNLGNFQFQDVTEQAGVARPIYGMGAVAADYDEDGDPDLYVSNFGQNILYRNNGDGTFSETTNSCGLTMKDKVGAGCAFLDIENDGDLDLYAGCYVDFTLDKHVPKMIGKHAFHPGPTDYPPGQDALFRNNGDGTFTDISQASGITSHNSYTMGLVAFDVDDDRDVDIMIGNDQRPNTLWINDGQGRYEDQATLAGVAVDRLGKANGNMGVEIGDVNRDGLMDIFTTTYQDEMPVLYMNLGAGQFLDQTNTLQIDTRLLPHVKWGLGLVDFDNDGDLDMYVACGHFMDNIQYIDDRTTVKVRDFVLENRGGKFVNVTASAGSGLEIVESSRGAAFEDFDNDGDVDVVVLNANARPSVLRNDLNPESSRHFSLTLIGKQSNRAAVGAKVELDCDGQSQVQQVVAGRGYQSHYGTKLHWGLGKKNITAVKVIWPSGHAETHTYKSHWGTSHVLREGEPAN